ncbi:MAG: F0F1 ATP synthase subunit A [Akkermansiaceae bacterium]|nr:F0F1 ATP synthase subunit A [Akkermansiaceae bacterium]
MPLRARFFAGISRLFVLVGCLVASSGSLLAAGDGGGHHEPLPAFAETIFEIGPLPITNSMIMVWIVAAIIILVAQSASRDMKLVPQGWQNFVEWLVETLLNFFSGIMGAHLAKRTFWFLGTVFILILFSNWFGLIPGVGTIGYEIIGDGVDPHDKFRPFLRGANADLNLTSAMALTFAILWFYWALTEIGLKNVIAHIFAPKGEFKGIMLVLMGAIFLMVGAIEVLSIAVRPIALMFRLYGNIYAGESMLENLMAMVPSYLKWLPPMPFYFLEILVGFVQALVFALLCAVFTKLICEHHDDHDDEHEAQPDEKAAQPA